MLMRKITCPFCRHQIIARAHVNVLCPCGAKYYIYTKEFWDRKDGKIVENPEFELEVVDDGRR